MARPWGLIGCSLLGVATASSGCVEDTSGGGGGAGSGDGGGSAGRIVQGGVSGDGGVTGQGGERRSDAGAGGGAGCSACGGAGGENEEGTSGSFGGGGDFSAGGVMPIPGCTEPTYDDEVPPETPPGGYAGAAGDDGIIVTIEHGSGEAVGERVSFSSWGSWDTRCYPFESSWVFVDVPDGSDLTDDDIESRGDPGASVDATFYPDMTGTYRVRFTLTTADGRSDSAELEFVVPVFPIPYVLVASEGGTFVGEARQVDDDGSNDTAIGPEFEQEPSSEETWIASDFEADVASRTSIVFPKPHTSGRAVVYPADLRAGARTIRVLPGYEDGGTELGEIEAPGFGLGLVWIERWSVSVNNEPPTAVFRLVSARDNGYSPQIRRETQVLPAVPIRPFRYKNRLTWLEGSTEPGVDFELWSVQNETETEPVMLMRCGTGENDFTGIRQMYSPGSNTLVALVSTRDSGTDQAIYRLEADEDGGFSCAVDSPQNERVYTAPSETEPILEFAIVEFSSNVYVVQQLADGRSTEIVVANYQQEGTPTRLVELDGRNTGLHQRLSSLVWTRTTYEPGSGVTRPLTSELWRIHPNGSGATRILTHESTPDRAVLITLGLNAGIKLPADWIPTGAAGAEN